MNHMQKELLDLIFQNNLGFLAFEIANLKKLHDHGGENATTFITVNNKPHSTDDTIENLQAVLAELIGVDYVDDDVYEALDALLSDTSVNFINP